jgi:tetratricopeptide (TPR) repeat protein
VRNKPIDWSDLLSRLEKQVVEGQHLEVKNVLSSLELQKVPRPFAAPFADLAWRVGDSLVSLKILNKFVVPENELADPPSDREKFIYAAALGTLGAVNEAFELFDTIHSELEPEVFLRKAMVQFRVWNYKGSLPFLESFLAQTQITPYRRLIGKINLAAALIVEGKYVEAEKLLASIHAECKQQGYWLLLGNSYELQAQIQFFQQNFQHALSLLSEAMELLKNQAGEFLLYAEKWSIFCCAFLEKSESSLQELQRFGHQAKSKGHWETVRECDLFEAILTGNEDLCRQVIIGTPYEAYRQRARRLFGKSILALGKFHLRIGEPQALNKAVLFSPYELQAGQESLHSKPQLLALFDALTLDFYHPSHIGLLFQRIYKTEKFNPFTSPNRVLSLIKRLNRWFDDQQVPLQVKIKKSEFALSAKEGTAVEVLIQRAQELSKQKGQLQFIRTHFASRRFSAENLAEAMRVSRGTALTFISEAIQSGALIKIGNGRETAYGLKPRSRKKSAA